MTKPRLIRSFGVWCVCSDHDTPAHLHEAAAVWSAARWKKENR